MAKMLHEISIAAPAAKVYEAIATQRGLRAWWTSDSSGAAKVGSELVFGFSKRATVFRMRVEELDPHRRIVWKCVGDHPEWKNTRLTWDISRVRGATRLRFKHARWRATDGWFAPCNTNWGELMHRLAAYAEGKRPGPRWNESRVSRAPTRARRRDKVLVPAPRIEEPREFEPARVVEDELALGTT